MVRNRRRRRADEVANTLERLAVALAARLDSSGWKRQALLPGKVAVFTRQVGEGEYFATLEIMHGGIVRRYDDWPADLYLRYGCGYWPTLKVMEHVGMDADPVLVEEPTAPERSYPTARIVGPADVGRVSDAIYAEISAHGTGFAASHSSGESMKHALADDHLTPEDVRIELLPIFLASVGRTVEAIELASEYLAAELPDDQHEYTEFVRRLREMG